MKHRDRQHRRPRWTALCYRLPLAALLLSAWLPGPSARVARADAGSPFDIRRAGAVGDGSTLNTRAIQATIDHCAAGGGGTVVVPKGVFRTGALFLKPHVDLQLDDGAVLQGSTDIADYPVLKNGRYEGHFRDLVAPLLSVDGCDHFRLTGPGTLDGNGAAFWRAKQPDGRPPPVRRLPLGRRRRPRRPLPQLAHLEPAPVRLR